MIDIPPGKSFSTGEIVKLINKIAIRIIKSREVNEQEIQERD